MSFLLSSVGMLRSFVFILPLSDTCQSCFPLFFHEIHYHDHYSLSFAVIKAPGMDLLKVSLSKPPEIADGVSVWEWPGSALDEGDEQG